MGKFELTPEILHQAAHCETVEEIISKAKEYGKDIILEQAQRIFELSHAQSGAVSDEELDSVAGGAVEEIYCCPYCHAGYRRERDLEKHISENHPEKLNEYLAKYKSC